MAKAMSITERVLRSIPVDYDYAALAKAQPWLSDWRDENGSKPSAAMLYVGAKTKKHGFGLEGMFVAMQLRPEGCTVQAFMRATGAGGAAHNNTRALVAAGYFERVKTAGPGQAETFSLRFTQAGEQLVSELLISDGLKKAPKPKPVAKVTRKRNAKAVAVAADAPEAVEATGVAPEAENAPTVTPEALQALAAQFNS